MESIREYPEVWIFEDDNKKHLKLLFAGQRAWTVAPDKPRGPRPWEVTRRGSIKSSKKEPAWVGDPFGGAVSVESKHGNRRTTWRGSSSSALSTPYVHVRLAFTRSLRTHSFSRASLAFRPTPDPSSVNMTFSERLILEQRTHSSRLRPVSNLLASADRMGIV